MYVYENGDWKIRIVRYLILFLMPAIRFVPSRDNRMLTCQAIWYLIILRYVFSIPPISNTTGIRCKDMTKFAYILSISNTVFIWGISSISPHVTLRYGFLQIEQSTELFTAYDFSWHVRWIYLTEPLHGQGEIRMPSDSKQNRHVASSIFKYRTSYLDPRESKNWNGFKQCYRRVD